MQNPSAETRLDDLLAETERAWLDRRDATVVDRLAGEHPEHATELYEFFSGLVFGTGDDAVPGDVARRAAERTRAWLAEEGRESVHRAASRAPRSFVAFLQRRTGLDPAALARRIGDVSSEFLVQVSRFPALVPARVREELASRIARSWSIPVEEILRRMESSGPVPRAASRRRPYPAPPETFDELLARSSLSASQRSLWSGVARG